MNASLNENFVLMFHPVLLCNRSLYASHKCIIMGCIPPRVAQINLLDVYENHEVARLCKCVSSRDAGCVAAASQVRVYVRLSGCAVRSGRRRGRQRARRAPQALPAARARAHPAAARRPGRLHAAALRRYPPRPHERHYRFLPRGRRSYTLCA